jgi:hypothetical protein
MATLHAFCKILPVVGKMSRAFQETRIDITMIKPTIIAEIDRLEDILNDGIDFRKLEQDIQTVEN